MSINRYDVGDKITVSVVFQNAAAAAADPDTVTLKLLDPSGTTDTSVYNASPAGTYPVVKDSIGNYHADVELDEAGTWHYRWDGSGTVDAADEGQAVVEPSAF